tara:strand:+ start:456 stop:671 length:216 start_codon:yes stop_codon:yes gene_type:complete
MKKSYAKALKVSQTKNIKGVELKGLTANQRDAMIEHSVHHTKEHIAMMVNAMNNGLSFKKSHEIAMQKVGK